TVFEHLNAPMETIRRFHEYLNVGGVLIFDYILSEGTGLDTKAGLEQREDVLAFIEQHFDIVEGKIDYDRSMRLTVARKK
ncbi:MAG: methyltransferase type 12, partial [Chloroflexota bacterium]